MSDIIDRGKALYWGTSEWSADEIRTAWDIADQRNLHKPVMEQPQYNILERRRVEREYARLYEDTGLGLTTWSPLASGLLTGKYIDGVPEGSRASLPGYEWLRELLTDEGRNSKVKALAGIAEELRSEEHTSEIQSLMRISYAVFCLQKKNTNYQNRLSNAEQQTNE